MSLLSERPIFQLGSIRLSLRNDQLEHIRCIFLNRLMGCTQFNIQQHSSQYTYVHGERS